MSDAFIGKVNCYGILGKEFYGYVNDDSTYHIKSITDVKDEEGMIYECNIEIPKANVSIEVLRQKDNDEMMIYTINEGMK